MPPTPRVKGYNRLKPVVAAPYHRASVKKQCSNISCIFYGLFSLLTSNSKGEHKMKIRLISLAVLSAVSASTAVAQNSVSANSSAGFDTAQISNSQNFNGQCTWVWDPITSTSQNICSAASSQSAAAQTNFNFREQKASASADIASPSYLHARAEASSEQPTFDKLHSRSSVGFNDQLTFDVAGHKGESVLVFMRYSVEGTGLSARTGWSMSDVASGNAYASFGLGMSSSFASGGTSNGGTWGYLAPGYTQSPYKIFSVTAGTQQSFSVSLSASCDAQSLVGAVSCSVDSTFRFLGISALALTDGTEIKDFSVKSLSGYDYLNPSAVPEPQTYLMLMLGLSALLARRKFVQG